MKPIQKNFALAAIESTFRLANEWRDTLSYSFFAAGAVSTIARGEVNTGIYSFFLAVGLREAILRTSGWLHYQAPQLAGVDLPVIDKRANVGAAAVVGGTAIAVFDTLTDRHSPVDYMLVGVAAVMTYAGALALRKQGKGLRSIPLLYFDEQTGMWDWPRKRGGGTTQTQKLIDGFKNMGRKIGAAVAPQPQPVPAGAMALTHAAKPSM